MWSAILIMMNLGKAVLDLRTPRLQSSGAVRRFELEEFVNLSGKYTKLLYRQLKQWRTQGHYSVLMKEFRELMDVPESYTTRDITKRIIVPSVDKLLKLKEFHFLRYKYSYKGKKAIRIIFTWHPETIPHASEPASVINSPSTLDLLREKQKSDNLSQPF